MSAATTSLATVVGLNNSQMALQQSRGRRKDDEMMSMYRRSGEYLEHYGVQGMKWGVRRYQNPDGSLTAEGRRRYYNPDGTLTAAGRAELVNGGRVSARSSARQRGMAPTASQRRTIAKQAASQAAQQQAEAEARRQRTRKFLMVAGGLALAGAAAYGGYKYLGKERDKIREGIQKEALNAALPNTAKDWDKRDIDAWQEMTMRHAGQRAATTTRGSVFLGKIGITTKSERVAGMRRGNEVYNAYSANNRRGDVNRQIKNARAEVKKAEDHIQKLKDYKMSDYYKANPNAPSNKYQDVHIRNAEDAKKRWEKQLDELLNRKAAM